MPFSECVDILLVDDDPDFAEMTGLFLERVDESFSITTATSASEGLELVSENEFDCIVSDYEMPVMNGLDFLREVRNTHNGLPFIMFTGQGSEEVASNAVSAGVSEYLQKQMGTDQFENLAEHIKRITQSG